ncbi:MAG: hypothetical protein AAGK14_03145 [Verrucomicrobiota bacterium]
MTTVSMPRMAMIFGFALIVVGLFGFYLSAAEDNKSWTALIPGIPGALMLTFGFLSRNEKMRMVFMHIAVLVGLLGFLAAGFMVGKAALTGEIRSELALAMQSLMFALCGGFTTLAVISFVRARSSNEPDAKPLS